MRITKTLIVLGLAALGLAVHCVLPVGHNEGLCTGGEVLWGSGLAGTVWGKWVFNRVRAAVQGI